MTGTLSSLVVDARTEEIRSLERLASDRPIRRRLRRTAPAPAASFGAELRRTA